MAAWSTTKKNNLPFGSSPHTIRSTHKLRLAPALKSVTLGGLVRTLLCLLLVINRELTSQLLSRFPRIQGVSSLSLSIPSVSHSHQSINRTHLRQNERINYSYAPSFLDFCPLSCGVRLPQNNPPLSNTPKHSPLPVSPFPFDPSFVITPPFYSRLSGFLSLLRSLSSLLHVLTLPHSIGHSL